MSPTSHRVRRGAACVAGLACLLGVSACGTGFEAQTSQAYQAAAGSNERAADLDVLNMLAVENTDGTATVSAALINKSDEDDSLTAVTGTDSEGNEIDVELIGPIALPPGKLVTLGEEAEIVLSGDLSAGYYTTLNLQFENGAPVEIEVPIVEREEDGTYDDIAEAPQPAPVDDATDGQQDAGTRG
ncbi:MAG: hypothetical protein ACRDO7_01850 [Nocardioidaceae bacterium]